MEQLPGESLFHKEEDDSKTHLNEEDSASHRKRKDKSKGDKDKNEEKIIKQNFLLSSTIGNESTEDEEKFKQKFFSIFTNKEIVIKSLKLSLKNWKFNLYTELSSLLNNLFSIYLPLYNSRLVNTIISGTSFDELLQVFKGYIAILSLKLILVQALKLVAYYFLKDSVFSFKNLMLENVVEKDIEFFDLFKTGELLDRLRQGENCIEQNFIFKTIDLFMVTAKFFFCLYYLLAYSFWLTIAYLISFGTKFLVDYLLTKYNERLNYQNRYKTYETYSGYLTEFISNIRLVKSFANEKSELSKLQILKMRNYAFFGRKGNLIREINDFVHQCADKSIFFLAGALTIKGKMTFGDIMVFQNYANQLKNNFNGIQKTFNSYWEIHVKWRKFFEIYDYKPRVFSLKNYIPPSINGRLTFSNVSFTYPLKPHAQVLKSVSLDIESGKVIAIVGYSGSGKSTLSNLIQRFYDPNEGTIAIDGVDIRDFDISWLRRKIGFVAQEPVLCSGTIEENILYGVSEYTQEHFDKVCELANVASFVNDKNMFPKGYKTLVGERGMKVSGGQKQRIAIARALMKEAKFLVFDEATSALDAESEKEVQSAIDNVIKERKITTIIIAHRLSTIRNADRIYFLGQGRIVEQGTHQELMELNGEYRKLIQNQLVQ